MRGEDSCVVLNEVCLPVKICEIFLKYYFQAEKIMLYL